MRCLLLTILLLHCFACGKSGGGSSSTGRMQEQSELDGSYRVVLKRVDESLTDDVVGTASLKLAENVFSVKVTYLSSVGGTHRQGITYESECGPDNTRLLVPFDGDIETQESGMARWPRGGSYSYEEDGKLDLLMEDLTRVDSNPQDDVVKLGRGESFNLEGRTITIYATANEATYPIACGRITRIPEEL